MRTSTPGSGVPTEPAGRGETRGQRDSKGEDRMPPGSWSCTEGRRPRSQEHGAPRGDAGAHQLQKQQSVLAAANVCEAWLLMLQRAFWSSQEGAGTQGGTATASTCTPAPGWAVTALQYPCPEKVPRGTDAGSWGVSRDPRDMGIIPLVFGVMY